MTRARWKKGVAKRRAGALDRLLKVKEPNERQSKEIEVLQKRINR
tara:strand:- start:113 stop:247 length:135 start_codon:yes stop_codon:yes gene_type:complete